MKRRGAVLILTAGLIAGCGGRALRDDGAAGSGATGTAGAGGSGTAGSGGSSGAATCAIQTRPVVTGAVCNTLTFGADSVAPEPLYQGDAGVILPDGGDLEQPVGGTIVDGDYDLVSFRSSNFGMRQTRRSIRIFDRATYIEWLMDQDSTTPDGGITNYRFDTTSVVSGTDLAMVMVTCGDNDFSSRFGYSAIGNELFLYQYNNSVGDLQNVFTYRRSCTR